MTTLANEIIDIQSRISEDLVIFESRKHGWKAAGARARKKSLEIAKLYKKFRAESVAAEKMDG